MQHLKLPSTTLTVSRLCYGGASWGTTLRGPAMDKLINAFRDAGGNFFDTAHCYSFWMPGGNAASELALGDYFKRNGWKGMVVATKGGHKSEPGYRTVDRNLAPGRIAADIDDSLSRLGVDVIDFYWLHRDDTREKVGDVIETLNREIKRGRIRYLGASNWTTKRIAAANAYAKAHKLRGFAASQPEWSLGEPNASVRVGARLHFHNEADSRWCEREGFAIVPYTPTAGGYFASKGKRAKSGFDNATSRARLKRVEKLAREIRCTPNQIALAYLLNHPFPVFPIIGTKDIAHLRDAVGALDVKLSAEQVKWLREG